MHSSSLLPSPGPPTPTPCCTGGTFALYSLLCRAMGVTPMGQQLGEADKQLSRYSKVPAAPGAVNPAEHNAVHATAQPTTASAQPAGKTAARGLNAAIRHGLATSHAAQVVLMVVVVIATSMVVGDGILTPAISVLSAVTGLKAADGVSISQGGLLCWHAGPLECSYMSIC